MGKVRPSFSNMGRVMIRQIGPHRCKVCNRFIGHAEIQRGEVEFNYIPDTYFTIEETIVKHKNCK